MMDRKREDDERRAKIVEKMQEEMRVKQEFRNKAVEYINNNQTYVIFLIYQIGKERLLLHKEKNLTLKMRKPTSKIKNWLKKERKIHGKRWLRILKFEKRIIKERRIFQE